MRRGTALLIASICIAPVGCSCGERGTTGTSSTNNTTTQIAQTSGTFVANFASLDPTAAPPTQARLSLDGYPVPVTVKGVLKGSDYTIELLAHDDLFDFEKYKVSIDGIALAEAAGEQYEPPIPLLKFPLHVGRPDEWTQWSGIFSSEQDPHPARATIETADDRVTLGNVGIDAIRTDVTLWFEPKPGQASSERRLSFWFTYRNGIIKRQFGTASVREPVPEEHG